MSDEDSGRERVAVSLESLRFVGPATAAALDRGGYDATAITDKTVSYRMLVDAGVNPGVAAKIRREHSLSWSFNSGGDLDRRSAQIRGLGSEEAAWVAASAGDWEESTDGSAAAVSGDDRHAEDDTDTDDATATPRPWPTHGEGGSTAAAAVSVGAADTATDGSGDALRAEAAWRARSKPTPVGEVAGVDDAAVDHLAEAGITSVRSLATADPEHVADVLGLSPAVVDGWYRAAREQYDQ